MIHQITNASAASISPDTRFLLDTNVLYYLHAGYQASPGSTAAFKSAQYSAFVSDLLIHGFHLYTTAANVQELMHVIERKEYELYCHANNRSTYPRSSSFYKLKDYRNNSVERANLSQKLAVVLGQIETAYLIFDIPLREAAVKSFVNTLPSHLYDPIDFIMVEDSIASGRVDFITDDQDFRSDTRLQIWTV